MLNQSTSKYNFFDRLSRALIVMLGLFMMTSPIHAMENDNIEIEQKPLSNHEKDEFDLFWDKLVELNENNIFLSFSAERSQTKESYNHSKCMNLWHHFKLKLPDEIGQLKNLVELDLSDNGLSSLPAPLFHLEKLCVLNLSSNPLRNLSEDIGNLKTLQTLKINLNFLTNLPESLSKLTTLTELRISSNKLKTLPDIFESLINLNTLHIGHNKLVTLPNSFSHLRNLVVLTLNENKLSILPEHIGNLTNLSTLYLEFNNLGKLPNSIGNLKILKFLTLDEKQITRLPDSFAQLMNLEEVLIAQKEIRMSSPILSYHTITKHLTDTQLNNLKILCKKLPFIIHIYFLLESIPDDKLPMDVNKYIAEYLGLLYTKKSNQQPVK